MSRLILPQSRLITSAASSTLTYLGAEGQTNNSTSHTFDGTGGTGGWTLTGPTISVAVMIGTNDTVSAVTAAGQSLTSRVSTGSAAAGYNSYLYDGDISAGSGDDVVVTSSATNRIFIFLADAGSLTYQAGWAADPSGGDPAGSSTVITFGPNTSSGDQVFCAMRSDYAASLTTTWASDNVSEVEDVFSFSNLAMGSVGITTNSDGGTPVAITCTITNRTSPDLTGVAGVYA